MAVSIEDLTNSINYSIETLAELNGVEINVTSIVDELIQFASRIPDSTGRHEALQEIDKELIKMERNGASWKTEVEPLINGITNLATTPASVFDFIIKLTTMVDRCDEYTVARAAGSAGTKLANASRKKCPKCGNNTLVPKASQDRGLDEGETQYDECATYTCDFTSHPKKKKEKPNELGIDDI